MASTSQELPTSDIMEAIMKDPMKKALILQLINKEKHNLEKYKRELSGAKTPPVRKQSKRPQCESPSALHRRRALLEMQETSESSSSDVSEVPSHEKGPELPFEELLTGVRAYIDVKRNGVDKSEGIKAIMKLMGATIRDTFTVDVTHVIFKDGSFTTYEKARLLKVHMVSILWLDAVRRNNARVPEKNYPAFGSKVCDQNVSVLCSQFQKDYESLVKDERRRRHTLMTPKASTSSYLTARNVALTDDEGAEVIQNSPDLTSDDSDCGVVDGYITKRSKRNELLQDNRQSSDSASLLSRVQTNRRKTINILTDMVLTPNLVPPQSNEKTDEIVEATPNKTKSKKVSTSTSPSASSKSEDSDKTRSDLSRRSRSSSRSAKTQSGRKTNEVVETSSMSSLRMSDSDKTRSDLLNSKDSLSSVASERPKSRTRKSKDNENCSLRTINTTMSSLRLSDANKSSNKENSVSSECSSTSIEVSRSFNSSLLDIQPPQRRSRRKTMGPSKPEEFVPPAEPHNRVSPSNSTFESPKKRLSNDSSEATSAKRTPPLKEKQLKTKTSSGENTPRRSRRVSTCLTPFKEVAELKEPIASTSKPPANVKTTRKLYNPDDLGALVALDAAKEREEYRNVPSQTTQNGGFLNPNTIGVTSRKKPKNFKRDNSHTKDDSSNLDTSTDEEKSTTKKKKKQKKTSPKPVVNDERQDLILSLEQSLNPESRRSQRLSLSQTKPKYTFSWSTSSVSSTDLPITPIKRRSTLDFVPMSLTQQKRKLKLDPKRTTSIVCTKLHREEVLEFEATVAGLGRFYVEDSVTRRTSHLVAGETKRTLNMLRAIARGCWILHHDWLKKSKEVGKWVNEEDYELTEFSPAVQQCRMQREAFGPMYCMDIFKDCGYIYLPRETTPRPADLKELILICKGHVTVLIERADIVVGVFIDDQRVQCVTEMWVLDSVKFNRLQSVKKYLVKADRENDSRNSPTF